MNGKSLPTEETLTLFGVTLNKPLTWKIHTHKINQKNLRRSIIMKKLSGTKWEAKSKMLRQVYQGYVRPAWCTFQDTESEPQYNNGAFKSSPTTELNKQTGKEKRAKKRNSSYSPHNILKEKTKNCLKSRKSPNHVMKENCKQNKDLLRQSSNY
ncbi:Pol-like protein [Elysia marginata]|uniref:Pol-like protein n=1 Tax=Elysia marginata TaxID=1093978 RepID=A0AAV4HFR1_9GAST|nr:Pol-like protein [Elysia marginata]